MHTTGLFVSVFRGSHTESWFGQLTSTQARTPVRRYVTAGPSQKTLRQQNYYARCVRHASRLRTPSDVREKVGDHLGAQEQVLTVQQCDRVFEVSGSRDTNDVPFTG